jgi:DNA-directed RNA polymerase specialized sigma24 family protein
VRDDVSVRPAEAADRKSAVEALYVKNFGELRDIALNHRNLLFADAERIAEGVARRLHQYKGPLEDVAFQEWATRVIERAAERLSKFYQLIEKNGWAIRAGIRSALHCGTRSPNLHDDDRAVTDDLFNEVCYLVFQRLDGFLKPGPAKVSTCLYALASRHTYYHVKKQRIRHEAVRRRIESDRGFVDLPEVLSDAEVAALKAAEAEEMAVA